MPEPPHPVNWNLLTADERKRNGSRSTLGGLAAPHLRSPVAVVPPFWHRHPELVWELSALHLHWLCAYDPEQNGSAPLGWHRDFADARERLRDWVAACGTRLDH
jgi:hypothetical protein